MVGAVQPIGHANRSSCAHGFDPCKKRVIVHDRIVEENFLPTAPAHVQRRRVIKERARSSRPRIAIMLGRSQNRCVSADWRVPKPPALGWALCALGFSPCAGPPPLEGAGLRAACSGPPRHAARRFRAMPAREVACSAPQGPHATARKASYSSFPADFPRVARSFRRPGPDYRRFPYCVNLRHLRRSPRAASAKRTRPDKASNRPVYSRFLLGS